MYKFINSLRKIFHLEPVVPLTDEPDGIGKLIASVNESAKQASAVTLTFLAAVVYIAITAGSTTDEQLLLNSPLTLPLFNVGVPAKYFYSIAPVLIVFLHLTLLLQEYFLAYRIYRIPKSVRLSRLATKNTVEADSLLVAPSIMMRLRWRHNRLVRFLLRLVFLAITVALPMVVLILIQVKFLPYHHRLITTWLHRGPIFLDLLLIWFFFAVRPRPSRGESGKNLIHWHLEGAAIMALSLLTLAVLFYSTKIAFIPEHCEPSRFDKWTGHRSLSLIDRVLGPHDSSSAPTAANDENQARGVSLSKRDLRCADFTGSTLINADFRSSDLSGANFLGAKLPGADFSPFGTQDRRRSKPTLTGVGVTNPFPNEGKILTRLENANFTQAQLRGANFRAAQLGHAHFENAELVAADFSSANLDDAKLLGALLFASEFKSTSLRHANFQGAQLQGANLTAAKAEYAVFIGASLEGANLSHARMTGAEFTSAFLQGSVGLRLQGIDLRQAKIARVSFCSEGKSKYWDYLDLRDVDFVEQSWSDLKVLANGLTEIPSEVMDRLAKAKEATLCLGEEKYVNYPENILYSNLQLRGWPKPQLDEDSYYDKLSDYLMYQSCLSDEPVRLAMERRVLERLTIDPEDALAKKLVRLLRQEIISPKCNFSFKDHEDIQRGILRQIDLPQ